MLPLEARLMWVACAATWGHGDVQTLDATEGHVWVRGLTGGWVCVDCVLTCAACVVTEGRVFVVCAGA